MTIFKLVLIYFSVGLVYILIKNLTELIMRGIGLGLIYLGKYIIIGINHLYNYIKSKFNK